MNRKFKVGDWVKCVDSPKGERQFLQIGHIYQVVDFYSSASPEIRVRGILELNPSKEAACLSWWRESRFILATYEEAYKFWLSQTKLKDGDEVRVVWGGKSLSRNFGWLNDWTPEMDKAIGGVFKVTSIESHSPCSGVGISLPPHTHSSFDGGSYMCFYFPFFSLEKVPKKEEVVATKKEKTIMKNSYYCTFANKGELTALVAVAQANNNLTTRHVNFSFEARKGDLFYVKEDLTRNASTSWGFCVNDSTSRAVFKKVSFQKMVAILSSYTLPPLEVQLPVIVQFGESVKTQVFFETSIGANSKKQIVNIQPAAYAALTFEQWEQVADYVKNYNKCGGVEIRERDKSK